MHIDSGTTPDVSSPLHELWVAYRVRRLLKVSAREDGANDSKLAQNELERSEQADCAAASDVGQDPPFTETSKSSGEIMRGINPPHAIDTSCILERHLRWQGRTPEVVASDEDA